MARRRSRPLDVVVIGAGAAGLAAARELSLAGLRVAVLEARPRIGGRILTAHDPGWPVPVELGAEFLHGETPATRAIAEAAGLATIALADRHLWRGRGAGRQPATDVWGAFDAVRRRIPRSGPDRSFAAFLQSQRLPAAQKQLARLLVEGYEAAPAEDVSAQSLALPPGGAQDHRQARLRDGQDGLVRWLRGGLDPGRVGVHLGTVVEEVSWTAGDVAVRARTGPGAVPGEWRGRAVVVTVPVGVLQAKDGPGAIRFSPPLKRHAAALQSFGMGPVVKVAFRLRRPLWDEASDFLHDADAAFPTWWTQSPLHVPVITGWAGGPRAESLLRGGPAAVLPAALDSLGRVLGRRPQREVEAWTWHDWSADPFSRGAYSYVRVGGAPARRVLARPAGRTVYFAGEALSPEETGTVEAALASGSRAARLLVRQRLASSRDSV